MKLSEIENRCFPDYETRKPPTPKEVFEMIRLLKEARRLIQADASQCCCMGRVEIDERESWLSEVNE